MSDERQIEDDYTVLLQSSMFRFQQQPLSIDEAKSDKSPNSFLFQTTETADVFFGFFPLFVLTASAIVISRGFNVHDKNAHFPDLQET